MFEKGSISMSKNTFLWIQPKWSETCVAKMWGPYLQYFWKYRCSNVATILVLWYLGKLCDDRCKSKGLTLVHMGYMGSHGPHWYTWDAAPTWVHMGSCPHGFTWATLVHMGTHMGHGFTWANFAHVNPCMPMCTNVLLHVFCMGIYIDKSV